uniref:PD-(D/E)XK endonuclease-like domain-containing protein n=1 Tax=viral metagenome TaxID=1070528 RepID=A0A6C0AFF8_9ZZZZ
MKKRISVTKLSEEIYPYSENRYENEKSYKRCSKSKAKRLHAYIDEYFKTNKKPENMSKEYKKLFAYFLKFMAIEKFELSESEMKVKDENYKGIIDAIFIDKNQKKILVDWKVVNNMDQIGYGFDKHFGLPISNYNRYAFQLNLYYYLLAKNGIKIDKMILVNFNYETGYEKFYVNVNEDWQNSIDTKNYPKYEEIELKIPFGIHKDKLLSEIPAKYLKYLCNIIILEKKYTEDLYVFKKKNNEKIDKSLIYLYWKQKDIINHARQYANNLCLECFENTCDSLVCEECKK